MRRKRERRKRRRRKKRKGNCNYNILYENIFFIKKREKGKKQLLLKHQPVAKGKLRLLLAEF